MSFYAVASSDHPHQWHDARSKVVTATDLSRLAHGGPAVWNTIKAEKAGHRQNISNAYIAHGVEREPVIARWAADELGLEHNTSLLVHADDERFGATPDLLSPDNSVVADIKTAKAPEWVEPPAHYVDQVLAQMLVTGAQSGYIIAEFHQDFIPTAMEPTVYVVERDDDRIDFLMRLAEQFLAMGAPSPMDALIADYADAKAREAAAAADADAVMEKVIHEIGDRDTFKHVSEVGSVTLSPPTPRKSLDKAAIERDFELADQHYKTVTPKSRPRVTPAKDIA